MPDQEENYQLTFVNQPEKQNFPKISNLQPFLTYNSHEQSILKPPAILRVKLNMLKDLLSMCTPDKLGRQYLEFKFIQICVKITELKPLIVQDQTEVMTLNCQFTVPDNLKNDCVMITLGKFYQSHFNVESVRKALPDQNILHDLGAVYTQKLIMKDYRQLKGQTSQNRIKLSLTDKNNIQMLQSWMSQKIQFTSFDLFQNFKSMRSEIINKYLQECSQNGSIADLGSKLMWIG